MNTHTQTHTQKVTDPVSVCSAMQQNFCVFFLVVRTKKEGKKRDGCLLGVFLDGLFFCYPLLLKKRAQS